MCGKTHCMYYGCDYCGRRLQGHILHLNRPECDCLNDTHAELCSPDCVTAYTENILGDCTCPAPPPATLTAGPTQK